MSRPVSQRMAQAPAGRGAVRSQPSLPAVGVESASAIHGRTLGSSSTPTPDPSTSTTALLAPVPDDIDVYSLWAKYLSLQDLVIKYERDNKELKAKVNELTLKLNRLKRTRKVKDDDPETRSIVKDLEKWGSHFVIFWNLVAPPAAFLPTNIPSFHHEDPIRYSTSTNKLAGITAEVYVVVAQKYHDILALDDSDAVQTFRDGMSATRSKIISYIQEVFSTTPGFPPSYFAAKAKEKNKQLPGIPQLVRLLGCTIDSTINEVTHYDRLPPILYRDGVRQASNLFLNVNLFRAARRALFGKSATESVDKAVSRSNSCISAISILVRYALSPDDVFSEGGPGGTSKINYVADFDFYKHYLMSAKLENPTWFALVLDEWNRQVFAKQQAKKGKANVQPAASGPEPGTGDAEEIQRLLDEVNLEEISDGSDIDDTAALAQANHAALPVNMLPVNTLPVNTLPVNAPMPVNAPLPAVLPAPVIFAHHAPANPHAAYQALADGDEDSFYCDEPKQPPPVAPQSLAIPVAIPGSQSSAPISGAHGSYAHPTQTINSTHVHPSFPVVPANNPVRNESFLMTRVPGARTTSNSLPPLMIPGHPLAPTLHSSHAAFAGVSHEPASGSHRMENIHAAVAASASLSPPAKVSPAGGTVVPGPTTQRPKPVPVTKSRGRGGRKASSSRHASDNGIVDPTMAGPVPVVAARVTRARAKDRGA
ncbi:hypothetical protein NLJ89_g5325 [Agrocybe chaxingu]|uniref:Uncharacterized protein n=1 Tax=Agrocybe chaxingu TaxID=84603 RepID=A0A9W8K107_9AGAR|nr:hypothetical protein NLJ89_g5325 [Agrocybe chaxingu]